MQGLENQIKGLKAGRDKLELRYEIKIRELQLRCRGLEEKDGENIQEKVVNLVAELLEKNPEEIDKGLDQIFRLRPKLLDRGKLPEDVIINVLSKTLKDEII